MKKKLLPILTATLLLCSCANGEQTTTTTEATTTAATTVTTTSATTTTTTTTPPTTTLATTTTPAPVEKLDYFTDYVGENIYFKDIPSLFNGLYEEISAEQAIKDGNCIVRLDSAAYCVFPKGISLNSVDDEWSEDEYRFLNQPETTEEYTITKINVGDTLGVLTVSEASCDIRVIPNHKGIYETAVKLDGELTLTGYITVMQGDEGYTEKGDIFFYADGGCENIPVLKCPAKDLSYAASYRSTEKFKIYSDMPMFNLGSVYTDYSNLDLSDIPEDGTPVKVEITISDISIKDGETSLDSTEARILSIKTI